MNALMLRPGLLVLTFVLASISPATAQPAYTLWHSIFDPSNNSQASAQQGWEAALDGNIAVIGAPEDDVGSIDSGVVKVYSASTGVLLHTLVNPSPGESERFGSSVGISGTRVVVGTPYDIEPSYAGIAYVYDLASATPTTPVLTLTNPTPATADSFGIAVAISGSRVVIGASRDSTASESAGSAYVYDLASASPTIPVLTLMNPSPSVNDWFGYSVAISDARVVVGAVFEDTGAMNAGTVYVYDLAGPAPAVPWITLDNPVPSADAWFGRAVAIAGMRVVVGAPFDDTGATNSGIAYLYDLASATPTVPTLTLTNPTPEPSDYFGIAVAVSQTHAVIGAYGDDTGNTDAGSAYVYSTTATPVLTLTNSNPGAEDFFGGAVAVSGSGVIVAAPGDSSVGHRSGSAYAYDLAGATPPVPVATLNQPSPASYNWFGASVAIAGMRCVVGAPRALDAGLAYIFNLAAAMPAKPVLTLTNPYPLSPARFSASVAIEGDHVLIGAPHDSQSAAAAGVAYVFNLAGVTPTAPTLTLTNPSPARSDWFGHSVAISGRRAVIGVPYSDAGAFDAGAVYVYDLNGSTPYLPALTLTNPSPQSYDDFGFRVAISGRWLAVGAPGDSAGAYRAGSAYIYDLESPTPAQVWLTLNNPTPGAIDEFGSALAISGTRLVIGAGGDDTGATSAGSAYLYDLAHPTASVPVLTLTNPSPVEADNFGDSVSISGTRVAIGIPYHDSGALDAGGVYVYDVASPTPTVPVALLTNPSPGPFNSLGHSVAIDNGTVIAGAPYDDTQAYDRGAAFIYGPLPALNIVPAGPGQITISWTPSALSGFVLQSSESLPSSDWVDAASGATNPVTIQRTTAARFYRLARK